METFTWQNSIEENETTSPAKYEGWLSGIFFGEISRISKFENNLDVESIVFENDHLFTLPGGLLLGSFGYGNEGNCVCFGVRGFKEVSFATLVPSPGSNNNNSHFAWKSVNNSKFGWDCCDATEGSIHIPYKFGQTADFSGMVAESGGSLKLGITAAFTNQPSKAAILVSLDDTYSTSKAVSNAELLASDDKLLGLLCCLGTGPSVAVAGPLANKKIPFIAPYSGSSYLRSKTSTFMRETINLRPGYAEEIYTILEYFLEVKKAKGIVEIHMDNAFGTSVKTLVSDYLCSKGLKPVLSQTVSENETDVSSFVQQMADLNSPPDAVLVLLLYGHASVLTSELKKVLPPSTVYGFLSVIGTVPFLHRLDSLSVDYSNLLVSQVVPDFSVDTSDLAVLYRSSLPEDKWDFTSFEGFIAGQFVLEILRRMELDKTQMDNRMKFLATVYKISEFNLLGIQLGPYKDWPCIDEKTCNINRCNMGLQDVRLVSLSKGTEWAYSFPVVYIHHFNNCGITYDDPICDSLFDYVALVSALSVTFGFIFLALVIFGFFWLRYVKRMHQAGIKRVSLRDLTLSDIVSRTIFASEVSPKKSATEAFSPEKSCLLSAEKLGVIPSRNVLIFGLPQEAPLPINTPFEDVIIIKSISHKTTVNIHPPKSSYKFDLTVSPETSVIKKGDSTKFTFTLTMKCTSVLHLQIHVEVQGIGYCVLSLEKSSEMSMFLDPEEVVVEDTVLGAGTYAKVFQGKWRALDVAVKVLNCQLLTEIEMSEFVNEVQILHKTRHPNIIEFIGGVVVPGKLAIVTELARCGNLKYVIENEQLGTSLKMKIALDIARGMQFLHQTNIIHRDLKPDNVLIVSLSVKAATNAKLSDFGSCKYTTMKEVERQYTAAIGTPIFQAPEVLSNKPYSNKIDVYSFGVLLWEFMTEEEPYKCLPNLIEIAQAVNSGMRMEIPQEMVSPLRSLIELSWAQDPCDRPTFTQIVTSIEDISKQYYPGGKKRRSSARRIRKKSSLPFPATSPTDHSNLPPSAGGSGSYSGPLRLLPPSPGLSFSNQAIPEIALPSSRSSSSNHSQK